MRTEWANETKDYPVEEAYISTNEGCAPFLSLSVFGDFTFLNAKSSQERVKVESSFVITPKQSTTNFLMTKKRN